MDSKGEKGAPNVARIQVAQTSLTIKQVRASENVIVAGLLPKIYEDFLTTTIFVKYHYQQKTNGAAGATGAGEENEDENEAAPSEGLLEQRGGTRLIGITVAALPNGLLQDRYNPTVNDTIRVTGPDSPARGQKFRTRLSFRLLKTKMKWRVQRIPLAPTPFTWDE